MYNINGNKDKNILLTDDFMIVVQQLKKLK